MTVIRRVLRIPQRVIDRLKPLATPGNPWFGSAGELVAMAMAERRVMRTGDYLADEAFTHAEAPDRYIRQHGIRSVMSAPLIGEDGAIGSLTVHSQARNAFDAANEELLEVLASQAAIAVKTREIETLFRERDEVNARPFSSGIPIVSK